jgi:hypothetical protein
MNNRLINTKVAGGGGCTDIVDNYDPFGGNGVALYQLNGDATDVSGNYNGTATNVTYGAGQFGQAGVFNGTSSKVHSSALTIPSTTSISVWVKPYSNTTNSHIFASQTSGYRREYPQLIWFPTSSTYNGFAAIFSDGGTPNGGWIVSPTVASINEWHHVVIVKNSNGSGSLYVDNQLIGSSTGGTTYTNTTGFTFGSSYEPEDSGFLSFFDGSIDQVRIFNTALTPLEVEALYTEELCICDGTVDTLDILGDGSCIATYQLDGNANDLSGNYSGTPTDVSYGVGEFDLAGVFNGSSSKVVNLSFNAITGNSARSISFWYKTTSEDDTIVTLGSITGALNNQFSIALSSSSLAIYGYGGTYDEYITGWTNDLTSGDWQHLVVTWDGQPGGVLTAYLNNNQEIKSLTRGGGKTYATSAGIQLGNWGNNDRLYNGQLDQVRIFNKALLRCFGA